MTRFERATNSLEGCDSTVELHPHMVGDYSPKALPSHFDSVGHISSVVNPLPSLPYEHSFLQ